MQITENVTFMLMIFVGIILITILYYIIALIYYGVPAAILYGIYKLIWGRGKNSNTSKNNTRFPNNTNKINKETNTSKY